MTQNNGASSPCEDRAFAASPSSRSVSPVPASIPSAFGISSSACFFPEDDAPEQFDGHTITWTFEVLKTEFPGPGLYELVKVRNLTSEERAEKTATLLAQAIEARRAETGTGSVHESAVAESHAPNPESPSHG